MFPNRRSESSDASPRLLRRRRQTPTSPPSSSTAKGSHKTYGGWEQRYCGRCGQKLTQNGPSCLWGQRREGKTWVSFAYHLGKCPSS